MFCSYEFVILLLVTTNTHVVTNGEYNLSLPVCLMTYEIEQTNWMFWFGGWGVLLAEWVSHQVRRLVTRPQLDWRRKSKKQRLVARGFFLIVVYVVQKVI
jgi:hypothetical protein